MVCGSYEYTPNGRRGIGLNQPQSGLDYPLIAPSADIRYLIADFYLAYEDLAQQFVGPLRIKWLYGVGCETSTPPGWAPTPTHAADILIVDANNAVVFNSTALGSDPTYRQFSTWCWGLRKNSAACNAAYDYKIYEWVGNTHVCRIVVYQTWPETADDNDEDAKRNYATHIAPTSAVIDERAVYKMPKRVNSLILPNVGVGGVTITRDSADLVAGLNTDMLTSDQLTRGSRLTRQITLAAIPGAGAGKYIDCQESNPPIRSINGLTGPKILLGAKDCLWLRTPTSLTPSDTLTPQKPGGVSTLQIGSNCPACCTCNDYVDLATYMNNTRDRYKLVGNDTNNVLLLHSDNIARWTDQRQCRLQEPIKVCMTAQRCPYLDVVAQYCNNCDTCAEDVVLKMDFTSTGGGTAEPVCGYTSVTAGQGTANLFQIGGTWPSMSASLGNVDAGNSVSVRFRLKFAQALPASVSIDVTGTTQDTPILAGCSGSAPVAVATTSRSLLCDELGSTANLC
jgi:hypothetical protein